MIYITAFHPIYGLNAVNMVLPTQPLDSWTQRLHVWVNCTHKSYSILDNITFSSLLMAMLLLAASIVNLNWRFLYKFAVIIITTTPRFLETNGMCLQWIVLFSFVDKHLVWTFYFEMMHNHGNRKKINEKPCIRFEDYSKPENHKCDKKPYFW